MTSLSGCSIRATRWGKVTVMGANAQTTVQKFLSGAVLTAEQQNFSAATGVPVFATTVTRDAAFGGANKVLAEGQTCYLESTNVVQYYDGAAWATVGPSSAGGLVPITPSSIAVGGGTATSAGNGQVTATSVTTNLSLNGVFSASYTNYRVLFNVTSAAQNISWRFRVGGTDNSSANYDWLQLKVADLSVAGESASNDTSYRIYASGNNLQTTLAIDIFRPFLTTTTGGLALWSEQSSLTAVNRFGSMQILQDQALSFDGLSFLFSQATTGTVSVYGYAI